VLGGGALVVRQRRRGKMEFEKSGREQLVKKMEGLKKRELREG